MKNYQEILEQLEAGTIRAAIKNEKGIWEANREVKEAILAAFKDGKNVQHNEFIDKHNILPRNFKVEDGIRIVPGGTSIRKGCYVAKGVIIMPPAYINIGAYVDEGSMVDSHALVGSCAQIGKRVHLSAAVQIGGVLEPIGMAPVVIEDDAFIGAGAVIVEGVQVKEKAVIAPGVILSAGVPVYDAVNERILDRGEPIPANAVVVPGSRPIGEKRKWANDNGLQVSCPIIIKYRDAQSNTSLELEDYLR
ncbi:MAG: 2,3,4,5-tetrahydropyridine-2,6-dicarboxylate N-succinyltransferase [Melioribacteraceae bacterium]|nr:2,3,4,5-tetrahydropyridine-2,6-dicarboxylate N-succinyltransferase [Melioribacteraceae bacterium]